MQVNRTDAVQPSSLAPSQSASASAANDRYAGDWAPQPNGAAVATPAAARTSANQGGIDPAQVHVHAQLAGDVYNDVAVPPAGYRVASDGDLAKIGLDAAMLEQPGETSFRARVYVSGSPGKEEYTIAFRGSQSGDDWKSNARQGIGLDSTHYAMALEIGKKAARSGAEISFVGHSLGGGLAAEAAIASGRSADTFNAAGLHPSSIAKAQSVAEAAGRGASAVNNYRVHGEILTGIQEGGDRVIGGALGGLLGGAGAIGGALLADAPPAYGAQHDLPDVRPEGTGFWDSINPVNRHGMDWVLAGTAAQLGR